MKTSSLINTLKKLRSIVTFWLPDPMKFLEILRERELLGVIDLLPAEGALLEIGAGTGWQAQWLANRHYNVSAIDLASSNYRENRVWPVIEYDGVHIPFENATFDIVFSSNVLEHIPHIREFQKEIHRVLKPGGRVVHVVPSSSWRFWTNVTHPIRYWSFPNVHGEYAENAFSELYYFSRRWWNRLFRETGWSIERLHSGNLFYTGNAILASRLGFGLRAMMSRLLGSATNIYVLREKSE